jgi:hypothetical protein
MKDKDEFEVPNIDTMPIWILEKHICHDVEWIRIVFIGGLL